MSDYSQKLKDNFHHFTELQKIVESFGFPIGGGSYMMDGQTLAYHEATFDKQQLLYETAKSCKSALEVGNYAGHSLFIMLLASDDLLIDANDINEFAFTQPCIDYLNSVFNNRVTYHAGNSLDIMPTLTKQYDLIHIDGCHHPDHINTEMEICDTLKKSGTYLVVDDIEGAIHGMTNHLHKLTLIERPVCLWPNAVYQY